MIMNKILRFSFIAVLAAIFNVTYAADAYKTLSFPDDNAENNKISAYESEWEAKIGNDSWTITNFNNNSWKNWTYIKCGHKSNAYVASIASGSIDQAIGSVVVTIDKIIKTEYINAFYVEVAEDAAFKNIKEKIDATTAEAGNVVFTVKTPAANMYYRLVIDCKAGDGKTNGNVQISKVEYYKAGDTPEIVDISNTPETAYTVAKAHELTAAGEGLATKVYIKGIITEISEVSTQYGNATYSINDTQSTDGQLAVFRGYSLGGEKFTAADEIKVGDEVTIYGQLSVYNGNHQITNSSIYSLNGTTDINSVTTDELDENAPIYNLAGQRVNKSTKGILIQNGKKFINK